MKTKKAPHRLADHIAKQDGGFGQSYVKKVAKLNPSKTATTKRAKKATLKR